MNSNLIYSNSPNHHFDSMQHEQGVHIPINPVRITPKQNIEPLKYTHYDFLEEYFNKYYYDKQLDPLIVLHLTKIIEISLLNVQDVSGLLEKYKKFFKL